MAFAPRNLTSDWAALADFVADPARFLAPATDAQFEPEDFTQPEHWFHEGQIAGWGALAKEVAIIAGTQGGKTSWIPYWLRREIQRCAPLVRMLGKGDFLFVGPTLTLLEAQALPAFESLFVFDSHLGRLVKGNKPKFTFSEEGAKRILGFAAKITVHFAYANDSSNLESLTALAGAWDEAGQKENKHSSYGAFNRRLKVAQSTTFLQVRNWLDSQGLLEDFAWWIKRFYDKEGPDATFGRRAWGTTPYEWNWFKTEIYDKAVSALKDWAFINFPSWMNPRISYEECLKERDHMPLWEWEMMYEGKYTKPAGLVFDCFDEGNLCNDFDIPLDWKRWGGLDFGLNNTAGVFWAQEPSTGEFYQGCEYHPGRAREFEEHVKAFKECAAHRCKAGDGTRPSQITPHCAGGNRPTEKGEREALRKHGIPIDEPNPNHTSPKLQYQQLYDLIKTKRLRIFKSCIKTIGQYQTFSYKLDVNNEPTQDFANEDTMHLLAGSRYLAVKVNPPKTVATFELTLY